MARLKFYNTKTGQWEYADKAYNDNHINAFVQSDMSENDPSHPSYIKNRLAWEEIETLLDNVEVEQVNIGFDTIISSPLILVANEEYSVRIDNNTYTARAFSIPALDEGEAVFTAIGDPFFVEMSETPNGLPFLILTTPVDNYRIGGILVDPETLEPYSGKHIITLQRRKISKIDPKFLPSMSDYNENFFSESGYIKNRPFYSYALETTGTPEYQAGATFFQSANQLLGVVKVAEYVPFGSWIFNGQIIASNGEVQNIAVHDPNMSEDDSPEIPTAKETEYGWTIYDVDQNYIIAVSEEAIKNKIHPIAFDTEITESGLYMSGFIHSDYFFCGYTVKLPILKQLDSNFIPENYINNLIDAKLAQIPNAAEVAY